jgi:hypothetical protein
MFQQITELAKPHDDWVDRRFVVRTKAVKKWGPAALARTNSWIKGKDDEDDNDDGDMENVYVYDDDDNVDDDE